MGHEDYATACAKFAESQRLEPAAGTAINLAECLDRRGQLADAWQRWKEARRLLRDGDDRIWAVDRKVQELEARLPRLTLRLEPGVAPDVRVERDGVPVGAASLGTALPLNPGPHEVVVRAPGHHERRYVVELEESANQELSVAPGPALPEPEPEPEPPPAPPLPVQLDSAPPPAQPVAHTSPARTAGFAVVGVGAASLVAGSVFGGLAIRQKNQMDGCVESGSRLLCDSAGLAAADKGRTYATVANVAVAVGVAGLGVGLYLVLSNAPEGGDRAAIGVGPTPGGGHLRFARVF